MDQYQGATIPFALDSETAHPCWATIAHTKPNLKAAQAC